MWIIKSYTPWTLKGIPPILHMKVSLLVLLSMWKQLHNVFSNSYTRLRSKDIHFGIYKIIVFTGEMGWTDFICQIDIIE